MPFWRLEMGIFILAAMPLLWRRPRRVRSYALGLAVGLTPVIIHMAVAGTAVFRNVFAERLGINAQSVISSVEWNTWLLLALCVAGPAYRFGV